MGHKDHGGWVTVLMPQYQCFYTTVPWSSPHIDATIPMPLYQWLTGLPLYQQSMDDTREEFGGMTSR